MRIALIAAVSDNNVIGKNNDLPWHLPVDMAYFKKMTLNKSIIMGRKTFESNHSKPLPQRQNIVVTQNAAYAAPGCDVAASLTQALALAIHREEIMVIGGSFLFAEALPIADRFYLTRIHHHFEGDIFFPPIDMANWQVVSETFHQKDEKNLYDCTFFVLDRKK